MQRKPFFRRTDWYFEGYTRREIPRRSGKGTRKVWVFEGEGYRFRMDDRQRRSFKLRLAVLCALYLASLAAAWMLPAASLLTPYTGVFLSLDLIPTVYMIIGLVSLLPVKAVMSLRDVYNSIRPLRRSLIASLILVGLSALGDIFYMVTNSSATGGDCLLLALLALGEILLAGMYRQLERAVRESDFASLFRRRR